MRFSKLISSQKPRSRTALSHFLVSTFTNLAHLIGNKWYKNKFCSQERNKYCLILPCIMSFKTGLGSD